MLYNDHTNVELRLKLFIVSAGCVLSAFFLTLSVVEGPRTGNLQSSIVAFTPGTQLAQVVSAPSSGLVAYWNFDEGAGTSVTDSSGNGVNGNLVNSPTWAAGKIGSGALTFNGYASKALVTVPNPSNGLLDFGTGNFSYSFWMNPQNYVNQNGVNYIISKKGTVGWDFETIAGGIVREVITDGTHSQNKQFGTGAALSLNTWHHIVVVNARSDSSGPYIYIDGVKQVCSGNCSSDFTTVGNISSTAKLTFASRSSENPANYYAGSLDDVHIYNRALSAAEVSALYASTGSSGNSNNNLTDSNGTATSTASTTSTTDTTAPTLSGGTPSGSLSSSVTSATISVTSNEPATCKYSTTAGTAYANMESTFSVTGGTTHASSVSGLQSGQSYNYYARCEDGSGNSNTSDYTVSFSVASLTVPSIPAATDAESVTVLGSALSMTGQTGWNFYNGMDSLEGGYMGWMYAGTGSLSGTVRLPKALPSGHYNIFLKGIAYTNLSTTISASLGGGTTASQTLNNSDTNGYWTTSMPIDVQSSSDTLTVTISKGGSLSNIEKYLFRGIYITSDTNEIVTKDDVAVDLHYPTVMDKSTPIKGNIVDNAGFEVGYGADWGFYLNKNFDSTKIWSTESSHSGSASLKIPLDNTYNVYGSGTTLISRVYHLLPNKMYTASAWVRASSPVSGYIRLQNTFTPPAGYPSQYGVSSQTATIGTSWTRISVSGYMLAYPTSDYQIRLTIPSDSNGNTLYVDDVQLEEGDLSNFAPQHAVEAGLIINKPSALFYDNESALGTVKVHNYGATAATTKVNYAIYDYLNRQVSQNSVTVNAPVGSTADAQTNLSIGRRGIFRLVLWIDGSDNSDREYVYSVVPQPRSGDVQSSFMGIHTNYNDWQLSVLRKMGINWNLDMSPAEVVRWSTVEPSQNQFVWNDARVSIAAASGMQIVGTLGVVAPSWAGSGDSLNLSAWQNYVTQTVAHYKPWIHYWEVWNEPIYVFSPTFYAKMLKTASDAITASDPTAVIVGMGGDRSEWMQSVITSLESQYPDWDWKSHIAIFSAHAYPGGIVPSTYTTAIIGKYSEPVWNTEAGAKDLGFYKGNFSNFTAWGKNLWAHAGGIRYYNGSTRAPELVVENFIETIGSGLSKYFYYDARIGAAPDYFLPHFTMFEYDGTLRTKGIAYAVAGSFTDYSTPVDTDIFHGQNTGSYLFRDSNGAPLLVLWSSDSKNRTLNLSLSSSQYRVYDMMGNDISGGINYGRSPVYVKGTSVSLADFQTALSSGSISVRSDSLEPSLSISDGPRGAVGDEPIRFRWIATDDLSYPNSGEMDAEALTALPPNPLAIQYSYRLTGSANASWSNWTPATFVDYSALSAGSYTFEVRAKDEAGNISNSESRSFSVGAAIAAAQLAQQAANGNTDTNNLNTVATSTTRIATSTVNVVASSTNLTLPLTNQIIKLSSATSSATSKLSGSQKKATNSAPLSVVSGSNTGSVSSNDSNLTNGQSPASTDEPDATTTPFHVLSFWEWIWSLIVSAYQSVVGGVMWLVGKI